MTMTSIHNNLQNLDGLATAAEAADYLGVSRSTIYLMMNSGQLPYVRIRSDRRIPKGAIREFALRNLTSESGIKSEATVYDS